MIDKRPGHRFQGNRAKDACVVPVVAASLGVVDRFVCGVIIDIHLKLVRLAGRLQQRRNVISEGVVSAPVNRACGMAVDGDLGVRHDAFKLQKNFPALPGRGRRKGALVGAVYARPAAGRL